MNKKITHRSHINWFGTFAALVFATTAQSETVTYYVPDHLGSPIAAMDQSGALLWRESYTPYGEKRINPSQADDDSGYTGHQFDADTDLVYMQARYYDPVIGRFLAIDPIGIGDGFNLYSYVKNNPMSNTDPQGLCTSDASGEPQSGYCPAKDDPAAAELLDSARNDPNSMVGELDAILEEKGLLATVSVDPEATSETARNSENLTLSGPAGSTVVIGKRNSIPVVYSDGTKGKHQTTPSETLEHESSHVLDNALGVAIGDGGPVFIDLGSGMDNEFTLPPGEGRAINRTNDYMRKSGKDYQRYTNKPVN